MTLIVNHSDFKVALDGISAHDAGTAFRIRIRFLEFDTDTYGVIQIYRWWRCLLGAWVADTDSGKCVGLQMFADTDVCRCLGRSKSTDTDVYRCPRVADINW